MPDEHVTVRIPELPEHSALANADRIPVWSSEDNKTRYTSLTDLRAFIESGEAGTVAPVIDGGHILYVVPASAEGGDTISIPSIAGNNFRLSRDGFPLERDVEYEVLSAGGAKLLTTTLIEGQRYEFFLYEYVIGVPPSPTEGGDGGGFIQGAATVNTNINISASDVNKVIQIRGASNILEVTLPDVEQCPDNSFLVIETTVNNTYQHRIKTTGGQYIYINNESADHVFIGKGENIWLYRKSDGWYAIAMHGNFTNVGIPKPAFKVGFNQLLLDGSELSRASYPRLWAMVETFGASLVTDTVWNTASVSVGGRTVERPYRGCFSRGNGSTTFRIPDFMNMGVRGVKSIGGSDTERYFNGPGGYQRHEFESHTHNVDLRGNSAGNGYFTKNDGSGGASLYPTLSAGGAETRMDNIGVLWVIDY